MAINAMIVVDLASATCLGAGVDTIPDTLLIIAAGNEDARG